VIMDTKGAEFIGQKNKESKYGQEFILRRPNLSPNLKVLSPYICLAMFERITLLALPVILLMFLGIPRSNAQCPAMPIQMTDSSCEIVLGNSSETFQILFNP